VLGEHVKVVAHAVEGVCCSSGVPLGDLEERVASPEVFANNPWHHPLPLVCLPRRLGSL